MPSEPTTEEQWYKLLTEGETIPKWIYHLYGWLPSDPRCKLCAAPFRGLGGVLMRLTGTGQSRYNPRYCMKCDTFEAPGGAEVEVTMLFADVRGSTSIAEGMRAREFSQLINRFYTVATGVLVQTDALVDRLVGDEVVGLYIPGMAGKEHPRKALRAAQELLELTGHREKNGPWLPVGAGVHTGTAFVGVVGGSEGNPQDFTALGDNVNITARLAAAAGSGEILVSEEACRAAGLEEGGEERRDVELKGRSQPMRVRVLRVSAGDAV
jgi:adenylate cyclase